MTKKFGMGDIPAGFNLEKYKGLTTMGSVQWYEQIRRRCLVAREPADGQLGPVAWRAIDEPLFTGVSKRRPALALWGIGTGEDQLSGRQRTAVGSLTMTDAQNLCHWMHSQEIIAPTPWSDEDIDSWELEALDDVNNARVGRWLHPTIATLRVNLEADPETVMEEFRAWWKAARKVRGTRRAGGKIEPAKWCEQQLLPFFDLTHWARSQGAKWDYGVLATVLFPDDEMIGKHISDTVKPRAKALISDRMLERLALAIARDEWTSD